MRSTSFCLLFSMNFRCQYSVATSAFGLTSLSNLSLLFLANIRLSCEHVDAHVLTACRSLTRHIAHCKLIFKLKRKLVLVVFSWLALIVCFVFSTHFVSARWVHLGANHGASLFNLSTCDGLPGNDGVSACVSVCVSVAVGWWE